MAESIALGMRLATADELATVAGIEGEISVTEGEWRAVVHDGVTKGGYPLAKLAEAGQLLTKSEDGTKLQLKNKDGSVLSELDMPSGGSNDAIPKTGDRGNLAGYEYFLVNDVNNWDGIVTINKDAPDVSWAPLGVIAEDPTEAPLKEVGETRVDVQSFTKVVFVTETPVVLGERWFWQGGSAPEIGVGLLIFHWVPSFDSAGVVFYVDFGLS